jgi:hypothetical protein
MEVFMMEVESNKPNNPLKDRSISQIEKTLANSLADILLCRVAVKVDLIDYNNNKMELSISFGENFGVISSITEMPDEISNLVYESELPESDEIPF